MIEIFVCGEDKTFKFNNKMESLYHDDDP